VKTAPLSKGSATQATPAVSSLSTAAQQRIAQLKADNELLQATVTATNARLAELERRVAIPSANADTAKLKLLEARLMRIQQQLQEERANNRSDILLWLIYAAAAIIVLMIVAIGLLMRRQPPHPAQMQQESAVDSSIADEAVDVASDSLDGASPPLQPVNNEEPVTESVADAVEELAPSSEQQQSEDGAVESGDASGVDHLTEADVYLRYGMEDEAEEQVNLALQLQPDSPEAHAKLVEVRYARGNREGAEAAKAAAVALLTGAALTTFEQLLPAQDQQETAQPEPDQSEQSQSELGQEREPESPADSGEEELAAGVVAESPVDESLPDEEDILASISPQESGGEVAVDGVQRGVTTTTSYQDDDELQDLLSTINDDHNESETDDVIDLSMTSADPSDLDALLSSISDSDEGNQTDTATVDDADKGAMTAQPAPDSTTSEQAASTQTAEVEGDKLDGELDFDLSDLDLSQAKVAEPLINSAAIESDSDLSFDASGLDLSGIVLPGSKEADEREALQAEGPADVGAVADDPAEKAASEPFTSEQAFSEQDEPEPSLPEPSVTLSPSAPPSSSGESNLEISLDMDDLDALLASDESQESADSVADSAVADSVQSVDEELGSLLDGLDDLDLSGDNSRSS
ncbi:MAG: hypothetical protein Q9M13_03740, partial [Mariprofundales bacterium]|nr:hypothetical protein [Mariprofundales bacterium]